MKFHASNSDIRLLFLASSLLPSYFLSLYFKRDISATNTARARGFNEGQ